MCIGVCVCVCVCVCVSDSEMYVRTGLVATRNVCFSGVLLDCVLLDSLAVFKGVTGETNEIFF